MSVNLFSSGRVIEASWGRIIQHLIPTKTSCIFCSIPVMVPDESGSLNLAPICLSVWIIKTDSENPTKVWENKIQKLKMLPLPLFVSIGINFRNASEFPERSKIIRKIKTRKDTCCPFRASHYFSFQHVMWFFFNIYSMNALLCRIFCLLWSKMRVEAVVGGAEPTENQDTPNLEKLRIFFSEYKYLRHCLLGRSERFVCLLSPLSL